MRLRSIRFCLAALLLAAPQAYAATIVDTGPGPDSSSGEWALYSGQWLAAEFTISEAVTISSVQGWMNVFFAGNLDIAIYNDDAVGGEIPGSELVRASGHLDMGTTSTWRGLSGLTWNLLAGTYWVAFEVRNLSGFDGAMPGGSAGPLPNEAFCSSCTGSLFDTYEGFDDFDLGVKIEGTIQSVPEPASSLALLTLGLASLGFFSSRRRNSRR